MDLRQFGLLLLVSRDQIPLFHQVYQGNLSDKVVFKDNFQKIVFKDNFQKILARFKAIAGSLENITLVFDQGNNSKKILKNVDQNIHFVGALSPYQHKDLIKEANNNLNIISVNNYELVIN